MSKVDGADVAVLSGGRESMGKKRRPRGDATYQMACASVSQVARRGR